MHEIAIVAGEVYPRLYRESFKDFEEIDWEKIEIVPKVRVKMINQRRKILHPAFR
jgi:hypothetical protein